MTEEKTTEKTSFCPLYLIYINCTKNSSTFIGHAQLA